MARASARRRLLARLAAELRERRRIEAATNWRSAFLRMMYNYPRPSTRPPAAAIIDPAMRLTDQRASILGRLIAYTLVAALAAVIFGLTR
jgi:hypothetical protein